MANAETSAHERRPKEETARLGDEIYRRDVKAQVEVGHDGEYECALKKRDTRLGI